MSSERYLSTKNGGDRGRGIWIDTLISEGASLISLSIEIPQPEKKVFIPVSSLQTQMSQVYTHGEVSVRSIHEVRDSYPGGQIELHKSRLTRVRDKKKG